MGSCPEIAQTLSKYRLTKAQSAYVAAHLVELATKAMEALAICRNRRQPDPSARQSSSGLRRRYPLRESTRDFVFVIHQLAAEYAVRGPGGQQFEQGVGGVHTGNPVVVAPVLIELELRLVLRGP